MRRILVTGITTALSIVTVASAASGWTPAQAAGVLRSGSFFRADANLIANIPSPRAVTARCAGVGAPSHGSYLGFRCAVTWREPNDQTQIASGTDYVRIWSSNQGCLSTANLASCPPAVPAKPLAHDPRVCSNTQKNLAFCVSNAANQAMQVVVSSKGIVNAQGAPVQLHQSCQAEASWTVYLCKWGVGSGTVSFVSAPSGWAANATLNP